MNQENHKRHQDHSFNWSSVLESNSSGLYIVPEIDDSQYDEFEALEDELHELEKRVMLLEKYETRWGETQKSLTGRIYSSKCYKKLEEIDQFFFTYEQLIQENFRKQKWREMLIEKIRTALEDLREYTRQWSCTLWVGGYS